MSQLNYQVYSHIEDQPWILLVHGLFGSLDNLAALKRGLTTDYNILMIDLPDHGKSVRSNEFSFEHNAELIYGLLNELTISKINIVAHSLGGKIAMQFALSHPELLSALIVLDIAPVHYEPRHEGVIKGLSHVPLNNINSRKEAEQYLAEYVNEASTRQFLLKSLTQDDSGWHWLFNLALIQRDYALLSEAIKSDYPFEGPTLFIKGEQSDYITADFRDAILQLFPQSQLKIIGGVGHWLHAEKPSLCIKMIDSFIKSNVC